MPDQVHEVIAVRYGTLRSSKSELYYRYGAYGEPDTEVDMAYYLWLLRSRAARRSSSTPASIRRSASGADARACARRSRRCARVGVEPASVSSI